MLLWDASLLLSIVAVACVTSSGSSSSGGGSSSAAGIAALAGISRVRLMCKVEEKSLIEVRRGEGRARQTDVGHFHFVH